MTCSKDPIAMRADDELVRAERLSRTELVELVGRLRARLGEAPPPASTLAALRDDELRAMVVELQGRCVERRVLRVAESPPVRWARPAPTTPDPGGTRRPCCVLRTLDRELAMRGRTILSRKGVPLIVADTAGRLAAVLAGLVPTDLVLEHDPAERPELASALGGLRSDVRIQWTTGADTTIAALLAVASAWMGA